MTAEFPENPENNYFDREYSWKEYYNRAPLWVLTTHVINNYGLKLEWDLLLIFEKHRRSDSQNFQNFWIEKFKN